MARTPQIASASNNPHGSREVYATDRGNCVRMNSFTGNYQIMFRRKGDNKLMLMSYNDRLEAIEALKSLEEAGLAV